jgi:DNA-binding CsgD family transcriptional regulator
MTDHPPRSAAALLERDTPLSAVRDGIDAVAAGEGGVLFVVGPAGIGKTSVLAAAREMAAEAGFRVVSAVGTPMEAGLPYGLIGQAAVALGGSPMEDTAELARLGGQPARLYRTFRFFVEAAAERPLLLSLDDLHWADADSLELLGFLCRRLVGARILVVGALRPEPDRATRLAEELVGSDYARVVALEPLSRDAAAALLGEGLEEADRARVLEFCAGSPLLLTVAASAPRDRASLAGVPAHGGFGRSLLLERFVGLSQEAFRYVQAGSVFGVRFKPVLAGALAGMDEPAWAEAHMQLVRAGLLDDLGGGWSAFVHPLFAQAVFEGLALSEREQEHARAFRLLVERGEPDAVAAEHATAARLIGDPLAVEVAARAGREALAQGALEAACGHLANAVELAGPDPAPRLLLDHAAALSASGQTQEAQSVCQGLLLRPDLDDGSRGQALTLLARTAVVIGEPVHAEQLYEQAAAAVGAEPEARASILADAAFTCHITSSIPWVIGVTRQALELIPDGTPTARSLRMLEAYARLMSGDTSSEDLLIRECREWLNTTRSGDHSWAWTLAVYALNAFKLFEDFSGATEVFEREFPRAVEDGSPIMINALAIAYADFVHRTGRPHDSLQLVQTANGVSDMHMAPWYEVAMSVLLTELGRDREAEPHLAVLRSVKSKVPPEYYAPVSLWLDLIEARQLLAAGEPEAASDAMLDAAEVARRSGWRHPVIVPWADAAVEAHLAAGRPAEARQVLDDLERASAPLSARWPRGAIALARAGLAAAAGRLEEADTGFREALRVFDELPLPIAKAEALVSYGHHLRRTGRPREARLPLRQALALAERTGSERVARLARFELAASGGRRRRRDASGASLTAQEERVAKLAAQGMSNAQIAAALTVTPKTVDNHLQQIYAKLGIHSRRELIR